MTKILLLISKPAIQAIEAVVTSTNVTCNGADNGSITISSPSGGYGSYEYSIDGVTWYTDNVFTGLAPGVYSVQVRDEVEPTTVVILDASLTITEPAVLTATVESTNVTDYGAANGTITITSPSGGYGTYQYRVSSTWQSSGSFTGLAPGTYSVQIRDGLYTTCSVTLDNALVITQPDSLGATVDTTNVTAPGADDGIIEVTNPSGGSFTYGYSRGLIDVNTGLGLLYNRYVTTDARSVAASGWHVATSADCNDLVSTVGADGAYKIRDLGTLYWEDGAYGTNVYGLNARGSGERTIYGGFGSQNQLWAIWQAAATRSTSIQYYSDEILTDIFTPSRSGLSLRLVKDSTSLTHGQTGTYTGNDGKVYQTICVGSKEWLADNLSETKYANGDAIPEVADDEDWSVLLTGALCALGNDWDYAYSVTEVWQGSGLFTGLAPGTYTLWMKDALTEVTVSLGEYTITEPGGLSATVASTNITCYGASNGTITISSPTGGYGTYEYSINGGGSWQSSGSFSSLSPSTYDVRVRDAANTSNTATLNGSLTLTQPTVLNATVTPTNVSSYGANDGVISITSPSGGSGSYSYSVTGGTSWQSPGLFENLAAGTYSVKIRDANSISCVVTLNGTLTLTQPASTGVNYYVKVGGNDSLNGLTDATAWATISKVNSSSFDPGDTVSFKKGGTWSEIFYPPSSGTSSERIIFNAYGSGDDPIITARGSVPGWSSSGNWTDLGSNRWRLSATLNYRFRLWIDGTEVQKNSSSSVTAGLPWYFSSNLLYVYSTSNPAGAFSTMELSGLRSSTMTLTKDYITFTGIDFRGGGGGGWNSIYLSGADHVIFDDCKIGKDSGIFGLNALNSNYGEIVNCTIDSGDRFFDAWQVENCEDGVQLKDNCSYWEIHENLFQDWGHDCLRLSAYNLGSTLSYNRIYDNEFTSPNVDYGRPVDVNARAGTAVGNEVYSNYMHDYPTGCQLACEGLKFYNNLMIDCVGVNWNSGVGNHIRIQEFEGFVPHDMQIYNNTIVGGVDGGINTIGWLPDSYLASYGTIYGIKDNVIANNNFYNNSTSSLYSIYIDNYSRVSDNDWKNNNSYRSGYTGQIRYHGSTYTIAQFNALNGTNGDVITNNVGVNPVFVSASDFHLQASSTLIGAGITPLSSTDYDGASWDTPCTIGAYEFVD